MEEEKPVETKAEGQRRRAKEAAEKKENIKEIKRLANAVTANEKKANKGKGAKKRNVQHAVEGPAKKKNRK